LLKEQATRPDIEHHLGPAPNQVTKFGPVKKYGLMVDNFKKKIP
jgi:hypothetical protein